MMPCTCTTAGLNEHCPIHGVPRIDPGYTVGAGSITFSAPSSAWRSQLIMYFYDLRLRHALTVGIVPAPSELALVAARDADAVISACEGKTT